MTSRAIAAGLVALLAMAAPVAAKAQSGDHDHTEEDAALLVQCVENARMVSATDRAFGAEDAPDAPAPAPDTPLSMADCIGVAAMACQEAPEGATTIGIVECIARETAWWDGLLNAHYADLRAMLDEGRATSLRDAQRAWIAFRDADCFFQYDLWREGTIRSIFGASCQLDHTARRAIALENFKDM